MTNKYSHIFNYAWGLYKGTNEDLDTQRIMTYIYKGHVMNAVRVQNELMALCWELILKRNDQQMMFILYSKHIERLGILMACLYVIALTHPKDIDGEIEAPDPKVLPLVGGKNETLRG